MDNNQLMNGKAVIPPTVAGAYNTYIGSRYIPVFDGQWDNSKAYEPLTIVQYQGNSYTSRTFVPIGVPVSNETFWAETGNYNAQIESYRTQVLALENQLIEQNGMLKKNIIIIGDDYAVSPDIETGYLNLLVNNIKDKVNSVKSYYFAGAGIYGAKQGKTFLQGLMSIAGDIPNKNSITDIYIIGGINDLSATYTNFKVGFNNLVNYISENYPNATIHLIYIAGSNNYNTRYLLKATETFYNILDYLGGRLKFFSYLSVISKISTNMNEDMPLNSAAVSYATYLTDYILTGNINFFNRYNIFSQEGGNVRMNLTVINDIVFLQNYRTNFVLSSPATIASGNTSMAIQIINNNQPLMGTFKGSAPSIRTNISGNLKINNELKHFSGSLEVDNYAFIIAVNQLGNNLNVGDIVTEVNLNYFEIVFPQYLL